eukprot:CAMPEP_0172930036 /NCGR_PEP_ID=MMETSP1075-20121228/218789_1 /TAXON_ID=2916 /ORGANISM="Ceratium fusus, Strain PA161109" /LENGTH=49 /DNA_ID=CAMNT_0013791345 /DNA_START=1141 /DNA_END=1290 /DNA_ORIENTATION=-
MTTWAVVQKDPDPWRDDHSINVKLDGPVVFFVGAITEEQVPGTPEDFAI